MGVLLDIPVAADASGLIPLGISKHTREVRYALSLEHCTIMHNKAYNWLVQNLQQELFHAIALGIIEKLLWYCVCPTAADAVVKWAQHSDVVTILSG